MNGIKFVFLRLHIKKGKNMRKLLKIITLTLVLTSVGSQAFAYNSFWTTPRLGGGYNYHSWNDGMFGWTTPRLGGGYNFNTW